MRQPSNEARSPGFDPEATVRAVLATYPETAAVFDRFGLMGCGGEQGPDERLDFFARAHQVPLADLLGALDEAVRTAPPSPSPAAAPRARPPTPESASRFVPFFIASLVLTLTLGATLGMINLARLTWTWGGLARESVWAHAYVQVFGFVALFVMGVGYHVLPRFVGVPLQASRLAGWSFWLQLGGVLATATGFFLPIGWGHPLWVVGSVALVGGAVAFAVSIARTLRAGQPEPFIRWVLAGAVWLVAASGIALVAALTGDPTWHQILWPAALFGFAGCWILGVGRRIFPVFLGWEPGWATREYPVFVLYQIGVVAWSVGAWPVHDVVLPLVRAAGAVALVVAVPAMARIVGLFGGLRGELRPSTARAGDPERGYQRYVYAAWGWLFVGLAAGPVWTLVALSHGRYGSILMLDFARHAVAFGFVTQMILGVASRVLPVFTGHRLWSPRLRAATWWLLNLGVLLRGLEAAVAAGVWPAAWPFIALSGPPAVAAMFLFTGNVMMTMRGQTSALRPSGPRDVPDQLIPDQLISDLLRVPGVLELLVEAGFTPLRNPAMRATFARTVTLRQACRMRDVGLDPLAERIRLLQTAQGSDRRSMDGSSTIPLTPVTGGPPRAPRSL